MQGSVGHPFRDKGDDGAKSGGDTKKREYVGMVESFPYFELSADFKGYLSVGTDRFPGEQSQGLDSNLHNGERSEKCTCGPVTPTGFEPKGW